jgi:mRNA interferase RelE/StbE
LACRIEFDDPAKRDLASLDKQIARRIAQFLRERIAPVEDARILGDALKGSRPGQFWRYRVGDYRIVCEIQDEVVTVLVIKVGHRREVYR